MGLQGTFQKMTVALLAVLLAIAIMGAIFGILAWLREDMTTSKVETVVREYVDSTSFTTQLFENGVRTLIGTTHAPETVTTATSTTVHKYTIPANTIREVGDVIHYSFTGHGTSSKGDNVGVVLQLGEGTTAAPMGAWIHQHDNSPWTVEGYGVVSELIDGKPRFNFIFNAYDGAQPATRADMVPGYISAVTAAGIAGGISDYLNDGLAGRYSWDVANRSFYYTLNEGTIENDPLIITSKMGIGTCTVTFSMVEIFKGP